MRELFIDAQSAFNAFTEGEEKGLEFFFNRYYAPLVYYATSITQNEAAAEDITSEAFLRLWQARERLSDAAGVKPFLYHVTRNAALNHLRPGRHKLTAKELAVETPDDTLHTLDKLAQAETYHKLFTILNSLPLKCRQVFEMFYLQNKAVKEIAEHLGISVNTVKSQKQRAIQLLREKQHLLSVGIFFLL